MIRGTLKVFRLFPASFLTRFSQNRCLIYFRWRPHASSKGRQSANKNLIT
jgi:hypothetical protein